MCNNTIEKELLCQLGQFFPPITHSDAGILFRTLCSIFSCKPNFLWWSHGDWRDSSASWSQWALCSADRQSPLHCAQWRQSYKAAPVMLLQRWSLRGGKFLSLGVILLHNAESLDVLAELNGELALFELMQKAALTQHYNRAELSLHTKVRKTQPWTLLSNCIPSTEASTLFSISAYFPVRTQHCLSLTKTWEWFKPFGEKKKKLKIIKEWFTGGLPFMFGARYNRAHAMRSLAQWCSSGCSAAQLPTSRLFLCSTHPQANGKSIHFLGLKAIQRNRD